MNSIVHRYAPPALVIGAGLFFGWPPAEPFDLGDEIVRTGSVRWRSDDLASPTWIEPASDPFREVLLAKQQVAETENAELVVKPTGPPEAELKAALRLDGFAEMGGRTWAVVNGRPRLVGDTVTTSDANRHRCEVVSIASDHVTVRCQETTTKILPAPFFTRRPAKVVPAVLSGDAPIDDSSVDGSSADPNLPPPPNA